MNSHHRLPVCGASTLLDGLVRTSLERLQLARWWIERLFARRVRLLVRTLQVFHAHTSTHSTRVAAICKALGVELGLSSPDQTLLRVGGLLHDIGKQCIPVSILDKPDRLTEAEYRLVQGHPIEGVRMLEGVPGPRMKELLDIVRHHHERLDGSGYPDRLCGGEITMFARIVAVADVYEALTSERPYRRALSSAAALQVLEVDAAACKLDPRVVLALHRLVMFGSIPELSAHTDHTPELAPNDTFRTR